MRRREILFALLCLLIPCYAVAQSVVKSEHIKTGWKFEKVMGASQSDAARGSAIRAVGNKPISSCLAVESLSNGVLPQECRLLRDFFCFTNDNAQGGIIAMDLGEVMPVTMVNSYSAHGPVGGTTWCEEFDGSRGPQVYTLYGSALASPDASNLTSAEWVKIAEVDTRPSDHTESWVGSYGVNIADANGGVIGNFRHIAWDVKSTLKPMCDNPNWTDTWYTELDVHTAQTAANGGDAIAAGSQLEEIIVVFKSHFDIGFTHAAPEIVNVYRTSMIDQALQIIDDSKRLPAEKQFSWTIPSWVAHQILWPGQDPVRRARVTEAIKNGRIVVHGLPVTFHTESLEAEDIVQSLKLNKRLSEELGVPISRSGKLTDVPSHSWILPTIMKNAGMDFLHIGVNPVNERPDVPLLYYWQGPDGSRLLTMHMQGYGSDPEFGHGLFPPKDWKYKHWIAMIVATDNAAPPRVEELEALLKQAEQTMPGVKVRLGKMEDFADAIFAEERGGAEIPIVEADMPDCWIHGVGTMPAKESLAKSTRMRMAGVKVLDSHLRAWGVARASITDSLDIAHERSLMFGEHTWGGNRNLEGRKAYAIEDFEEFVKSDKSAQYLIKTWNDHAAYIDSSAKITDALLSNAMDQLARGVAVKGDRVVVYNPLPWRRDAIVEIPDSGGKTFVADNLPACGYNTYPLISLKMADGEFAAAPERQLVENDFYKIILDRKHGGIVSIINKKDGREMVDQKADHAFGQYFFERFDSTQVLNYHLGCSHLNTVYGYNGRGCKGWNIRADLPGTPGYESAVAEYETMDIRRTATATEVVLKAAPKGIIKSKVTSKIVIPNNFAWIDVTVQLDDKQPEYWPQAGAIYLPVNAAEPQFRIGRLGAVVDPTKDFVRGSNRTYGYVNTGAMIGDRSGRGVAMAPLNNGLMSFGKKGICTIDPDYVPTEPLALASIFNTVWTINFPYWIDGSISSTVRIWATDDIEPGSLIDGSIEARNPVLAVRTDAKAGKMAKSVEGIKLSRSGVQLTTMEPAEGGGEMIRLWECAGQAANLTVTLPKGRGYTKAVPVDLRGEPIAEEPLKIDGDSFSFALGAYAPVSFVLR